MRATVRTTFRWLSLMLLVLLAAIWLIYWLPNRI